VGDCIVPQVPFARVSRSNGCATVGLPQTLQFVKKHDGEDVGMLLFLLLSGAH
jgi:hypothetical protein